MASTIEIKALLVSLLLQCCYYAHGQTSVQFSLHHVTTYEEPPQMGILAHLDLKGNVIPIPLKLLSVDEDITYAQLSDLLRSETRDLLGSDKSVADTDKSVADTDKSVADTDKSVADTDKSVADTDKSVADTDKSVADTDKSVADADKSAADTDKSAATEMEIHCGMAKMEDTDTLLTLVKKTGAVVDANNLVNLRVSYPHYGMDESAEVLAAKAKEVEEKCEQLKTVQLNIYETGCTAGPRRAQKMWKEYMDKLNNLPHSLFWQQECLVPDHTNLRAVTSVKVDSFLDELQWEITPQKFADYPFHQDSDLFNSLIDADVAYTEAKTEHFRKRYLPSGAKWEGPVPILLLIHIYEEGVADHAIGFAQMLVMDSMALCEVSEMVAMWQRFWLFEPAELVLGDCDENTLKNVAPPTAPYGLYEFWVSGKKVATSI